jgi:CheY-like chemotaxis protein
MLTSIYREFIQSKKYFENETIFKALMQRRIYRVLLICSNYDAYMLEEDGRIDEQIFKEYVSLNLRYPPVFIQANSATKAFSILEEGHIDLVISMLSVREMDAFELSNQVKGKYPDIPIVVLTHFSREVTVRLQNEDLSSIDYVFSWLGNADLLLAIVKLIEDRMNVEHDVNEIGVQVVLLVEDSVRFYSSYLPNLYRVIFNQSERFMKEGLNEHLRMLRKRGRPKVMMARNYEEAISLYKKYSNNMLGVISDIRYHKDGMKDPHAGFKLCEHITADNPYLPFLLQSSEPKNRTIADKLGVGFLDKNSNRLSIELRDYVINKFAFGDFVFKCPTTGEEVGRAHNLVTFQEAVKKVPAESLRYHAQRHDFSKWLKARSLFSLSSIFFKATTADFGSMEEVRQYVFDEISRYRINRGRGVISKFEGDGFDEYSIFSRIGDGSIGGKARGLAFVDSVIKKHKIFYKYENIIISIPRTIVLCTDVFDEFMQNNHLYEIALLDIDDDVILKHFLNGKLPEHVRSQLKSLLSKTDTPLEVLTSRLLEYRHYQPFAGIYSTYMIPYIKENEEMLEMLYRAIKSVYASVFFKSSKAYMEATKNVIDEEKMAIILQEVTGSQYGDRFYPTISGVARSVNFYPIEPEKAEDGIASIGLGLGKVIVEGGKTLRFSPKYPKKVLQLSTPQMALTETQKKFFALSMKPEDYIDSTDDGINMLEFDISEADKDNAIKKICSIYDFQDNVIRDGSYGQGKKLITFSGILKYNSFPLSDILNTLLNVGQREMNHPVEIEFAVNLDTPNNSPEIFSFLQIRPIVEETDSLNIDLGEINYESCLLVSNKALGNGVMEDLFDFVYVKPDAFSPEKTKEIAEQIDKINRDFRAEQKNYILVGPGRWGSRDPWLGIPIKWSQISEARLIVESGLPNYRIDPSQGTHFFQNLTSFRIGYFTVNPYIDDGKFDVAFLDEQKAVFETDYIRHVRFNSPAIVKIEGKKNLGIVLKP